NQALHLTKAVSRAGTLALKEEILDGYQRLCVQRIRKRTACRSRDRVGARSLWRRPLPGKFGEWRSDGLPHGWCGTARLRPYRRLGAPFIIGRCPDAASSWYDRWVWHRCRRGCQSCRRNIDRASAYGRGGPRWKYVGTDVSCLRNCLLRNL